MNHKKHSWVIHETKEGPSPRTYFGMTSSQTKVWMIGGFGDKKNKLGDLHAYDIEKKEWDEYVFNPIEPVYLHSVVCFEEKLYVFGGNDGKSSNKILCFDIQTSKWKTIKPKGVNKSPVARHGHAAAVVGRNMIISGGCDAANNFLDDTHLFNFDTEEWEELGKLKYKGAFHSMVAKGSKVYSYGGFNGKHVKSDIQIINIDDGKWEELETNGLKPSDRCGCISHILDNNLYVYGGFTSQEYDSEVYVLNLELKKWSRLVCSGAKPFSRAYLQSAHAGGVIYVFGGFDGKHCLSNFCSLRLHEDFGSFFVQEDDVKKQVDEAIQQFDNDNDGKLNKIELKSLLSSIQSAFQKKLEEYNTNGNKYPFDTSQLKTLVDLGWDEEKVLKSMKVVHAEGRNTKDVNYVLDVLLRMENSKNETNDGEGDSLPAPPSLNRGISERTELRNKLQTAIEEKEDMQTCKVCLEKIINCVLLPCSHLIVCRECANELKKAKRPCPLCRKPTTKIINVFWT